MNASRVPAVMRTQRASEVCVAEDQGLYMGRSVGHERLRKLCKESFIRRRILQTRNMWLIVEEELALIEDKIEDEAAARLSSTGPGGPLEIDEVGLHAVQIGERVYGH